MSKSGIAIVFIVLCAVSLTPFAEAQAPPAEVTLGGTAMRRFTARNGSEHDIYIAFPMGYQEAGDTEYPVLYLLDAAGQFALFTQTYRLLQLGQEVPPMIIVGIDRPTSTVPEALASRMLDLTPTRVPDRERNATEEYGIEARTGGADAFLATLNEEIIPWIDDLFPTSSERGLAGYSLGGLFAVHVLLTAPESFTHYLIGSPSLWWDDGVMFGREEEYASRSESLPARVFLSAGTEEDVGPDYLMLPNMLRLTYTLEGRGYEGLELTHHIFEGETHLSAIPGTMSRGLRFLFGVP